MAEEGLPLDLDFAANPAATPERMNAAMLYLLARLRALEAINPSFQATIDEIRTVGLNRVTEALAPIFLNAQSIDDALEAIQAAWQDNSVLAAYALAGHTHTAEDITDLAAVLSAFALLASPEFTGIPKAPTAAPGTNTTQLATTAFAQALADNLIAALAPKASPALTGTPTGPTAAGGTNTTQLATTAFVQAAIAALVASSPSALDTLNELAAALGNDANFATTVTNALALKAASANPALTGAIDMGGSVRGLTTAMAALNIDCSAGNYFTKTINGNSTFTVSNVPAGKSYAFALELTHTSGTVTWFAGVQWPDNTAPVLTTGKVHLFVFHTDDGGATWRGAVNKNYAA